MDVAGPHLSCKTAVSASKVGLLIKQWGNYVIKTCKSLHGPFPLSCQVMTLCLYGIDAWYLLSGLISIQTLQRHLVAVVIWESWFYVYTHTDI